MKLKLKVDSAPRSDNKQERPFYIYCIKIIKILPQLFTISNITLTYSINNVEQFSVQIFSV